MGPGLPVRHASVRALQSFGRMFFSDWASLGRVIVTGVVAYASLLLLLRISGKRTLAKMNAFDFVVTVALGSTLASMLLSKDTTIADGVMALAVLIGCQFVVAWAQVRSSWVRRTVKSEPALLFYRGEWLPDAMVKERVTRDELLAAMRSEGALSEQHVAAVVLETDGSVSVVRQGAESGADSTLVHLTRPARTETPHQH